MEYLTKANFWREFHKNLPTQISNLWNTFSDNDNLSVFQCHLYFFFRLPLLPPTNPPHLPYLEPTEQHLKAMANYKKDSIISVVMHVLTLQLFPLPKIDKAVKPEFLSRFYISVSRDLSQIQLYQSNIDHSVVKFWSSFFIFT